MHKITSVYQLLPQNIRYFWEILLEQFGKYPLPMMMFLGLCFNLLIAPVVYGATGEDVSRQTAYSIGILICVILGLSIYLFVVIFQPERF